MAKEFANCTRATGSASDRSLASDPSGHPPAHFTFVKVNAVSPGPTRTEGTAPMGENLDQLAATSPLNRVGTAAEVAAGIVFLASDTASMVHGTVLPVDGGRLAV